MRRIILFVIGLLVLGCVWGTRHADSAPSRVQIASTPTPQAEHIQPVVHFGGEAQALFIDEPYAYVTFGPSLIVLDISDPARPEPLASLLLPGIPQDMAAIGSSIYLAAGTAGVLVVEVSQPSNPYLVRTVATVGTASALAVQGEHLYVAAESALQIFSLSAPAHPAEVSRYEGKSVTKVAVAGPLAYMTDAEEGTFEVIEGLTLLDISDPQHPQRVGHYASAGRLRALATVGRTVYTFEENRDYQWLKLIDMSNPTLPTIIGQVDFTTPYTWRFEPALGVAGNYLYFAHRVAARFADEAPRQLALYDISSPTQPRHLVTGTLPTSHRIALSGNYLYSAARTDGFRVLAVSTPFLPIAVAEHHNGPSGHLLEVSGDRMLLMSREVSGFYEEPMLTDTLRVIDLSDLRHPVERGSYAFSEPMSNLMMTGTHAYLQENDTLHIVDFSDPDRPDEVATYIAPGTISDVELVGSRAYVTWWAGEHPTTWGGMKILDLSDPALPTELGEYNLQELAGAVTVKEGVAYLITTCSTCGNSVLRQLDVRDAAQPEERYAFPTWRLGWIIVSEGRAYVGTGEAVLALDLSDPAQPMYRGSYYPSSPMGNVTLVGEQLYLTDTVAGLRVLDASNMAHPAPVGFYGITGLTGGVSVAGRYAYVTSDTGIYVLEYEHHRLFFPLFSSVAGSERLNE